MRFELDRQRYLDLSARAGVSAALTALHGDMELVEHETFEGSGLADRAEQTRLLALRERMRELSRELWAQALANPDPEPQR
jgi:hypothetical protein